MKTISQNPGKRGAVSFLMVLVIGTLLLLLTIYTYRQAVASHEAASFVQLSTDYSEKEDTILRAVVALTPNRAIMAMQGGANDNSTRREPLRWESIFSDAIDLANARTSISDGLKSSLGISNLIVANSGDSSIEEPKLIFDPIPTDTSSFKSEYLSAGINRDLGSQFPPPLQTGSAQIMSYDEDYPIISTQKIYSNLASGKVGLSVTEYPIYNLLKYPQINFGYAKPGDDFVAKRNWWAFNMNLANSEDDSTKAARMDRTFVLSIYEIPSQLAISASSFMSLGEFGNGQSWGNVTISGGVFASKAVVQGDTSLTALASRRGMSLSSDAVIGGESFVSSPFTPGVREVYQLTEGDFFPVSLASEGGRVAFVPINREAAFLDRFVHSTESNTISPTKWNDYSAGALQCAMRLDIIECVSSLNPQPTKLRFSYYKGGVRQSMTIDLVNGPVSGLAPGYIFACNQNQTYNFGTSVVDLAYGRDGAYFYEYGATGWVTYNNERFGNPYPGYLKAGYYKPSYPFEVKTLDNGKHCVYVYPQRMEKFLDAINADDTSINNSLVVNVDYTAATGSVNLDKPGIPCTELDYGVVLEECADMTSFPKGFSLVTNLRTYIGDDFNVVPGTPPAGYAPSDTYYPPCSLFAPEKRFGVDIDPYAVQVSGQVGSLASDSQAEAVRPLDSKSASGVDYGSDRITVNLRPIPHPAELPPITMMNWLVVLQEVRNEFVNY